MALSEMNATEPPHFT